MIPLWTRVVLARDLFSANSRSKFRCWKWKRIEYSNTIQMLFPGYSERGISHMFPPYCWYLSPISRSYLVSIVCIGLAHQRSPKVKTKPAILLMMSMVNFDDYNVYISLLLERWKLKITCFPSFFYFTRLFVMLCKRRQCFNSFPVTEMLQKPDLHQVNVNNNAFALSWMH